MTWLRNQQIETLFLLVLPYIFLSKLLLSRGGCQWATISGDSASILQKCHQSLHELRPGKALCFAQFEENSLLANRWIFPGFCPHCRGINAECRQTGKSILNHDLQQVSFHSLPAGNCTISVERAPILSSVCRATTTSVDKVSQPRCALSLHQ